MCLLGGTSVINSPNCYLKVLPRLLVDACALIGALLQPITNKCTIKVGVKS